MNLHSCQFAIQQGCQCQIVFLLGMRHYNHRPVISSFCTFVNTSSGAAGSSGLGGWDFVLSALRCRRTTYKVQIQTCAVHARTLSSPRYYTGLACLIDVSTHVQKNNSFLVLGSPRVSPVDAVQQRGDETRHFHPPGPNHSLSALLGVLERHVRK